MKLSRRSLLQSLSKSSLFLPFASGLCAPGRKSWVCASERPASLSSNTLGYSFSDVGRSAGLQVRNYFGGEESKRYILETTGCGVAFFDYDNDGWLDIFLVNGSRLSGFPAGQEPTNHLFHNNRDGTFTDVTEKAGLVRHGWGQGVCIGDYDNDGLEDLFVTYWGHNVLYHNNGDGTFADVSEKAGVTTPSGYYGLGVLVADFDNDGWPDVYVANDATPSILFHNNHDGTFTDIAVLAGCAYDENGRRQSGMGATAGDYDGNGWLDIFKTNFSEETTTLYRNNGNATFTDVTYASGTGKNDRYVGWGCVFFDPDNDGWLDIFYCNGHVYPELERASFEVKYREPSVLYRNLGDGRFDDVSGLAGAAIARRATGRGCAFGDFDNDGDIDIIIDNMNDYPTLLRCDRTNSNHWIKVRALGVKSNRSGIGARLKCVTGNRTQIDEVRSGGSYPAQNDLRVHFGLGTAPKDHGLEGHWPSGQVDVLRNLPANQVFVVREEIGRAAW